MNERQGHRRAAIGAAIAAALLLPGSLVSGVAVAGQGSHDASAAGSKSVTTVDPTIIDPTATYPTTTDPTATYPTTTDPTTTAYPTTTFPTTTTVPPGCVDPGPQEEDPGPASDEPAVGPDGGSSVNDAILDVATRIMGLWRTNQYSGFSGMVAAPEMATLRLYWLAGDPLPPEIEAIVADPGQPITVAREDAPYSRAHLEPLAPMLLQNHSLFEQMCGFLHSVKVLEEGTGLIAGVAPYDATFDIAQAEQLLSNAAGVPVTVEVGEQATPYGRLNDTAPWFAGAKITSGRGECSSAFGVDIGGVDHMLTALHCFPMLAMVSNGNGTAVLGRVVNGIPALDSEIIRVTQAGTSTYFGGVGAIGAAEYSQQVRRPAANIPGVTVACTSGASTGENCRLVVIRGVIWMQRRWLINGRIVIENVLLNGMVEAMSTVRRRNGQLAVASGQGDSGGPVVTDSARERYALGVIYGGAGRPVHCGLFASPPGAPPKQCSAIAVYADIDLVLRGYGAVLK